MSTHPDYNHAIITLEIHRDILATNEPIDRREGNIAQADYELESLSSIDAALKLLRGN